MTSNGIESQTDVLPIGPLQHGLWLFWKLNPKSSAYNMPEVFHFEGEYDPAAAQFAFDETIRRHEALRTTFRETYSGIVQVVDRDPDPVPIKVVDLRGLPEPERTQRLTATIEAEMHLPFDLSARPAIRLTAIPVTTDRTSLVLVVHHVACDGTSMVRLLDEFGEFYRAARRGTPPDVGPPPPGYTAFVRKQLAALADDALADELAFWRQRLAGVSGSALPGDGGATQDPESLDGCVVSTVLDADLAAAVLAYARHARATPFSIMLCAMKVMVAAATGDSDVALGTATSGRTSEFAGTVGMLANTLVVRSEIDISRTFAEVLEGVSLDLMDAIDYQNLPFSQVITELSGAGLERGEDVVRTMFAGGANGGLTLGEGRLSDDPVRTVESAFDLVTICYVDSTEIALDWEYALRTYSRAAARGYCDAFLVILRTVLHQPDAPMSSLGLTETLARLIPRAWPERSSTDAVPDAPTDAVPADQPGMPADDALTSVERAVASIWSEVLNVAVETPSDNFFRLGGHSMLASQTVALVRNTVSRVATLRMLFDHPQLREFCSRLDVSDAIDAEAAG
ncbi:MAG: condensation domain-containing protein [Pseudonocardiaceae bacterium]